MLLTPPLFHPNFGGVPVVPDRPCWGQCERYLKLFGREIIFEVFQPVRNTYLNITDSRTDELLWLMNEVAINYVSSLIFLFSWPS